MDFINNDYEMFYNVNSVLIFLLFSKYFFLTLFLSKNVLNLIEIFEIQHFSRIQK